MRGKNREPDSEHGVGLVEPSCADRIQLPADSGTAGVVLRTISEEESAVGHAQNIAVYLPVS